MGNNYKKQVLAKAKQNRINHVTKNNKYYNTETSKSQQDFIAGDIASSASKKAYYYKQNGLPEETYITGGRSRANYKKLQNGENPYEATYIYDGKKRTETNSDGEKYTSRKRFLTDDEKEALKTTGSTDVNDYKKNYKYAILRGVDSDGKNFDSQFNLRNKDGSMKWDGMNVAKNKVAKGGSKLNYVGGFLKDTVVDAGVDLLKKFDRYESGAMGGALGFAENAKDVTDSIFNGDFSFKNVDTGRIKKNWNESMEESNKTGFGHSAGHYLKGMSQRNDDQMYESILKSSGQKKADEYKKTEEKVQGVENVANTVLGLGLDFLNPVQIGSAFAKTLGFAGKNTIKAGKQLLNGTSDISTGFKSDSVLDVLTNQGPLAKTNKRGSMLNQEYDRVMSKAENVKQVIKSNPKTQNLGHFLDEIGESIDSGVQKSIDGRTLNNKYTQVADDYVPQTIRGEGEVDNIVNNNKSNQLSFNSSKNLNNKYDKLYKSYDNEDELFDAIDELDNRSSDEFLDWLKNKNPSTYQKYMGNADELDEFANQGIQVNRLSEKRDESLVNNFNKNAQTISTKPKYDYEKVNSIIDENAKISSTTTPKTFKNNYERKHVFEGSIRNLSKNIQEGKIDAQDISNTIQKVKGEGVPTRLKREYINNKLFNGDNVLASNVSGKSLDGLLDSVEDLINLKKVSSEYMQTGEVLSVKLSDATKKFLKVDDNLKIVGSKVRGNKIESPEDLVETLNKSIVDRARALTDERYGDKLQLMANEFGYKNYDDITTSLDNLVAKRKALDTTPNTPLDEKLEISANIKRLKEIVSKRTDMWEKIKNLPESDFDKLVNEKYPHHIENLNSYGNKVNQRKEMQQLSKLDEFTKLLDETADATNNRKLTIDDFYNEVAEEIKGTQKLKDYIEEGGNVDELIESQARIRYNDYRNEQGSYKLKQNIDNRNATITEASNMDRVLSESPRLEQENLSDVGEIVDDIASRSEIIYKELKLNKPKINKSNIKLSNGQKLGHLPPVKENSAGLKRVIQHEMEMMYKEPKKYLEYKDSFKQIKKEYVNSMRSYGVKDSSYFEKVKNLQDDLDLYYKELNKPTSIINKSSEGGPGTPKNGMNMNLQLLAKKIEDTFSEFDENIAKEFGETLKGKQLNIDGRTLNKKRTQTKDGYVPQMLRNSDDVDDVVKNANESEQLSIFDEISNSNKTKGKLNSFLKSIEDKFKDSNISGDNLEKILDSKKKKYLKQKGISDANNPLYKNFKFKDGQLPSKSAKRLENGNVVDLENGQVKYSKSNKGDLKKIVEDNKYHYKNKEENTLIEKLLSNPDPKPEHFMGLFDKMKIKCDFSDEKSVEKAFKQFDNIVQKKIKNGDITLNKAKEISKEIPKTYNAKNLKEFEKSPLSVLSEKLAEAKKYGDDASAKYFEKQIHSRGTDEIIKNIKQARTIEDKQRLYERLMQQSEYAYNGDNGFKYYEEMSDWLMNQGGLDIREKNAIIDYMKKEQSKLAQKGIDPNTIENKAMRDSMRKQQYSHEVNRNFETAQASKSDLENILEKEKNRKPNQTILDRIKQSDGVVKEPKPKKRIRVKEAEEQVAKNLEIDKQIEKKVAKYKDPNNITPIKETPLDNITPRTVDDMLENEVSNKKIGETLDKDIKRFEEELSQENPPTFEKFKKFFTEKSQDTKVGYEEGGLYKAYKAWLNSYKKGLTVYNPGWHVQNFFQNKGQNYLALGPQALTSQKNARNVLSQINGVDKGAYELVSKSGKTYTKKELASLAKKYNVAEGMATNTTKSNGILPWLETKVDNSGIMQKALQSEQTARLHHFLTQLERGMSPEEASKSVNKYLFDYGSKTKADKMMSDFVDPFWSFHKSNAKMLTTAPFKHPSEVNNILRANRGLDDDVSDDEKVPNSFREHQLPFGSFKDEINNDNYNYFYDENMMPDVSKALPLESSELENKMNPLLRIALQQSRNEGNFGNKIVDKDKSDYNEVTKSERGGEIATELNPLMNPLVKAYMDSKKHQKKTDDGKQTQSTTDIQKLMELVAYITGNKGAYYRDTR